jgi:hypothetical protein
LDEAPDKEGYFVGNFGPSQIPSYVGRAIYKNNIGTARIQTKNQPGGYVATTSHSEIITDPNNVFFMKPQSHHSYSWAKTHSTKVVPFAVETGTEKIHIYVGRVMEKGKPLIGHAVPLAGVMYYVNWNGNLRQTTDYEVLTCKSKIGEGFVEFCSEF